MGRYTRFAGVRGVERDVWELIQWHALHDEGRRRLGRPEDDRALFAKFLSFRECISHFGGKSDNALLVLGDRHPCSWWYVLEKFTEVRHWRCHRNHPLPNRLDANPSGFHRSQYAPWCGANQGTNGSGSVCLGRRVVCKAASRLKGGCGQDCPPNQWVLALAGRLDSEVPHLHIGFAGRELDYCVLAGRHGLHRPELI